MKNKFILALIMFSNLFSSKGQEVESAAYSLMLKGLLSHSVNEVSVHEIDEKKSVVFVDSREKKEYEVSHLPDAIWVGYDNLNLKPLDKLDKNQEIIVYCSVGYRSEQVCKKLEKKGFTNVSNLYGGIFEWINQGKEVIDSEGKPTQKVHAYNKTWGIWLNQGEKVY